ncbi:hypothetical protein M422DRAFT_252359 [Sphaerobolus stellatus SS14]|uniref:Uncharacterized protein n=1 Tax=Sphaerobolus stellatus (strain SS14) TaxID=990650 RepID=A0A0C9W0C9_SPHS4|nr:hypothetical protein M422DRAFT_252359 [Sphaerobolus stellatus SS14]
MPSLPCPSTRLYAASNFSRFFKNKTSPRRVGRRFYSSAPPASPNPTPKYTGANRIQEQFSADALRAFRNLGKILAWTGYGAIITGLITVIGFEGGHMWIERQMRIQTDEDAKRWGWEPEGWTGGEKGGTSSSLGLFGRHAVRAAWFALHYSTPAGSSAAISYASDGTTPGALNLTNRDLQNALVYLQNTLSRLRMEDGKLRPDKVTLDLLERHASVLERIGTRAALVRAMEDYVLIHEGRDKEPLAQAQIAVKLGNLSERLGDGDAALAWWIRGIKLIEDKPNKQPQAGAPDGSGLSTVPPAVTGLASKLRKGIQSAYSDTSPEALTEIPIRPPSSPLAQRTLVAALLGLSAYYSRRGELLQAKYIEERAIALIDVMVPTGTDISQSPGETLHRLYLLHRKSVLFIHHAEVTYSLRASSRGRTSSDSLTDLMTATSLSERIAQVLTGKSSGIPESSSYLSQKPVTASPRDLVRPPAAKGDLTSNFEQSAALRPTAKGILRDAKLTAAEAWDLSGVLYRDDKDGKEKSAECFARALGWAGEPGLSGQDGMSLTGWEGLWKRYVEARERVGPPKQS